MGMCNYCLLKRIRRNAKKDGKRVKVMNDPFHCWNMGKAVYVYEKGSQPTEKDKVAWLAEVPTRCEC